MKNKLFYLTLLFVSALTITSCASRKYGCPNSNVYKVQTATSAHAAA